MGSRVGSGIVAILIFALGVSRAAGQAADKAAVKTTRTAPSTTKAANDYETVYARYLQLARQTATPSAGPRWMDSLFSDPRARAVNDLLTIRVIESVNAVGTADASVNKSSSSAANIAKLFGLEGKIPGIDPANLLSTGGDSKFKGGGSTTRTGGLTVNLTVRVAEVLANGDLALEGAREIGINGDSQVLVLTGVVRQADIGAGNVVPSTSIGQLRIQYVGKGLMRDSLNPGWLIRLFNKIF